MYSRAFIGALYISPHLSTVTQRPQGQRLRREKRTSTAGADSRTKRNGSFVVAPVGWDPVILVRYLYIHIYIYVI